MTSNSDSPPTTDLAALLRDAVARRAELLEQLGDTDCYRLFHGVAEGWPGVALDRYGPILLAQTWRAPLTAEDLATIATVVAEPLGLTTVWNHRTEDKVPFERRHAPEMPDAPIGHEFGMSYDVRPRHRGRDPLLFLDLRALRRRVRELCGGKSVLNLFAYTCGVGVSAASAGAHNVWNVDFARSAIEVGKDNAKRNGIGKGAIRFIQEDVLCISRQLAGLGVGLRKGQRHNYQRVGQRTFGVTVLDPPRWATSRFGAVDVVRDYPTLFKPALLATEPGGQMLVTNHHPAVELDAWLDTLRRSATKARREIGAIEVIEPDADFPSFDGKHPLKMALLDV